MQPLDVSVFGPLTGQYRRLVNAAAEHIDAIDKALFATLYSQAREKVMTQTAAWKAFANCGMTVNLSPEKVLAQLAGHHDASQQTEALQGPTLQPHPIPGSDAAMNVVLDAFRQEPDPHNA